MDECIYEYGRQYEYTTPGNRNQYVALQLAIGGLRLLEENECNGGQHEVWNIRYRLNQGRLNFRSAWRAFDGFWNNDSLGSAWR